MTPEERRAVIEECAATLESLMRRLEVGDTQEECEAKKGRNSFLAHLADMLRARP